MKIISSYRDYYDWVAHKHGGGDPLVTYKRDHVVSPTVANLPSLYGEPGRDPASVRARTYAQHIEVPVAESVFINEPRRGGTLENHEFMVISVAGRAYFFERKHLGFHLSEHKYTTWALIDEPYLYEPKDGGSGFRGWPLYNDQSGLVWARTGEVCSALGALHIKHGAPVFSAYRYDSRHTYLRIDPEPPVLEDFGLASVLPAEQCYQEIAQMVGQIKHARSEVPEIQTSEQKIESHGFDKRKSFRHRK